MSINPSLMWDRPGVVFHSGLIRPTVPDDDKKGANYTRPGVPTNPPVTECANCTG